jgi:hypothetical protein
VDEDRKLGFLARHISFFLKNSSVSFCNYASDISNQALAGRIITAFEI